MKFFIPAADNAEQSLRIEFSIREHLGQASDRRIFRLWFRDNKSTVKAEVNKTCHINGERIELILYDDVRKLYSICTHSRGVAFGGPILVGEREVTEFLDFDETDGDPDLRGISEKDLVKPISVHSGQFYYGVKCRQCDHYLYICPITKSEDEGALRSRFSGKAVQCSACKDVIPIDRSILTVVGIR